MALIKRGKQAPEAAPAEQTAAGPGRMPVAAPKRRTGALALAVALAVIGGLLMWMFQQSSAATAYLTVNKQVDRGTVIEQSMLSTVEVVGEPANLIPAQNSRQVIGKVATADLAPGTTVTGQNTADSLGVETGRTVVGLALSSGRLPGRELKAGDQVQVVYTPNAEAVGDARIQTPIPAVVEGTGHDDASGARIVDLNISEADAAAVAAGDTLWDLALRYEVSVGDLLRANSLSPNDVLRPGRTLVVPGAAPDAAPEHRAGAAASSSSASSLRSALGSTSGSNVATGFDGADRLSTSRRAEAAGGRPP